ncbi:hypothetical protein EON73_04695 [bacterium]|nr:MAG: hypothetical protein EON73_04695 [bacterium]
MPITIWVSIERTWIRDEHENHQGSSQSTMDVLTRFTTIPTSIQSIRVSIERSWIGDEHENHHGSSQSTMDVLTRFTTIPTLI